MSETWVWDRYWQYDRIASCFDGGGSSNYDGFVADGWRTFFDDLRPKSRILDLCTGNGAVALIAAQSGGAKAFSITAVDGADIDPITHVTRHRDEMSAISFIGRTNVEQLPFDDDSFDAVVSQYGVEYSDMPRAISEAVRVLAPGGHVRFVVHASDGIIAANARKVIADADLLLSDIDLIGATRRCLDAVGLVEHGDVSHTAREQADAAIAQFKAALKRTAEHVPDAIDKVMLQNSRGVLLDAMQARHRVGYEAVTAKIDHVETEILAHRGRLEALVEAALDKAEAEALAQRLGQYGSTDVRTSSLTNDRGLIGHVVTVQFA